MQKLKTCLSRDLLFLKNMSQLSHHVIKNDFNAACGNAPVCVCVRVCAPLIQVF